MTSGGPGQRAADAFETARVEALTQLERLVGMVQACTALGVNRATYYRHHRKSPTPPRPRRERSEEAP